MWLFRKKAPLPEKERPPENVFASAFSTPLVDTEEEDWVAEALHGSGNANGLAAPQRAWTDRAVGQTGQSRAVVKPIGASVEREPRVERSIVQPIGTLDSIERNERIPVTSSPPDSESRDHPPPPPADFPLPPPTARHSRKTRLEVTHWAVSGTPDLKSIPEPAPGASAPSVGDVVLTAPGMKTAAELAGLDGPNSSAEPVFSPSSTTQPDAPEPQFELFGSSSSTPKKKVEIRPPGLEALLTALEDHDWGMDSNTGKRVQTKSEVLKGLQDALEAEDQVAYLSLLHHLTTTSRLHASHPLPTPPVSQSQLRKIQKTMMASRTRYMLYVQRTLEKLGLYLGVQASLDGVDSVERLVRKVGKRGSSDTGGSGSDAGKSAEGLEASAEDGARGSVEGLDVPNGDQLAVEYISDAVDSEQVEVVEPEAKEADSGQLSKDLGEEPERSEEQTANMADLFSGLDALDGGRDVADGKEVAVASVSSTEEPDSKAQTALNDPRHTILSHFFLLSVIDGLGYPPYARTLLRKLAAALQLDSYDVARIEAGLSAQLSIFGEEKVAMNDSDSDKMIGDRERKERIKRWAVTALAFAGGGALIGLSAGVMAPLIGAGVSATLGMVGVGGTAGFLGSTTGAAVIAAGGAGIGGTLSAKKMAKRTGRLGIFELLPVRPAYVAEGDDYVPLPYPSVTICVSGWLTEGESDFHAPWSTVSPGALGELHTLRWDPDDLVALGSAFKIITAEIISFGVTQFLGATVLHALMLGLTLPMWVAKLGYALDNPWGIGLSKAKKAGLVLADALAAQVQAHRPVTLVGFSLGARVVFYCLLELAQRGQTELVEDVYLAGAPVMATEAEWTQCVAAVSGRIVNGYLPGDWVLGLLYRASTATFAKVAGLHAVTGVEGLENVDLTGLVEGHLKYRVRMPRILEKFGVKVWREWIDEEDEEEWRQAREAEREAERKAKEPRSSSSAAEQAANLPLAKPKFEGTDPQLAEPAAAKEPEKSDIWTWQDILELKNIQDQMSGYFEPRNLGESTLPPLVIADDAFGEDGPSSAGAAVRKAVRRQDKEPEPDRSGMKLEMDALSDDESEPVSSRGPGSVAAMDSFAEEGSLGEVEPKVGGLDMDEVMDLLANGRAGGSYPELRAVMQAAEAAVGEQPTSGVQLTVDSVTQQQQQVYGYVDPAPPPQPAWYYGGMPPAPAQISPRIEPQLGYVDDSSRGYVDQGYVDQQPLEQILGAVSRSFERSRDSGGESPQLVEDRSSPRFAQGNESQVGNWQGYQASSGGEFASPAGATEYGQPADEGFNWSAVSSGQVTMPGIPLESTEPQEADADAADADVELDDELPESETVASVQTDFSGSTGSAGKRKKKKKGKKR